MLNQQRIIFIYLFIGLLTFIECFPVSNKENYNKFIISENSLVESKLNKIRNLLRYKRDIDFSFEAEHEDGLGTDVFVQAVASIWKSEDGKTLIDGSARYNQHFGTDGNHGNTKIGGKFNFKRIY